ncbi:GDSL-type esterase/lipase family protein [Actinoplanes friuliensis]|uniref:Ricin B lectin n=1 Tax=Actinoplanes friuliensis DSM 7358 TaxID=1246995 RepID=U5W309_9ACTN|nr:GDSL-type esterase/lipase family protein [Actinoplanes friuliensis]AGZ43514.1 ricin B lectin [Actinoplanes friuliensis DSM 7358]
MRRLHLFLAALVVALVPAIAAPAQAAAVTGRAVKIMPLGDSITWGTGSMNGSIPGSGYRAGLWTKLVAGAGLAVDFVGSMNSGSLPDTDNEGHSGYRIDQITANVTGWLTAAQPDVILLHIGTNDFWQDHETSTASKRLGLLLDKIHQVRPSATLIVAEIVPTRQDALNTKIDAYNAAIPGLVATRAAAGHNIRSADLHDTMTDADFADTLHPNNTGYEKMANLWHSALEPVLGGGREWPLLRTGLEPGETAPTWIDTVDRASGVGGYQAGLTTMETGPRTGTSHGGANALMYSGNDQSTSLSYSYMRVFDTHLRISPSSVLSYWIRPQQTNGTYVAVGLLFTDGSSLRDSTAVDQYGVRAHPLHQGQGGHLVVNQWNLVTVSLSALAGRTVDRVQLGYDQPAATGVFRGFVDDIAVTDHGLPAQNLALDRPATATTEPCAETETPAQATDGVTTTNSKWCTRAAGQWQVDLGTASPVGRVVLRHASAGGESLAWNTRAYHVETSEDGETWTAFATVTDNADGITTSSADPVTARHVRVTVDAGRQDEYPLTRIYEVEVYAR